MSRCILTLGTSMVHTFPMRAIVELRVPKLIPIKRGSVMVSALSSLKFGILGNFFSLPLHRPDCPKHFDPALGPLSQRSFPERVIIDWKSLGEFMTLQLH